jgi:hypothetical protein
VIYIWVRKTLDWQDEKAFWAQLRPSLRAKVEAWNATFTLPYHLFRHRVREIAALNLSKVEGAACAGWDEIPDGALVLPVDDDDWFAPDAARILESELRPGVIGYVWTGRWIEVPMNRGHRLYLWRRRLFPSTPPRWVCSTNTYAMLKSPETREPLRKHEVASDWFGQRIGRGDGSVRRIEAKPSAVNRTLASQTTLGLERSEISRSELLSKYRRHRRLYRRRLPPELAWSRPYVAMMAELMDELEPLPAA